MRRAGSWLKKKDYAKALADVSKAMSLDRADLESYLIHAGKRRASPISPSRICARQSSSHREALASADVKKKIDRLTKATPYPGAAPGDVTGSKSSSVTMTGPFVL